MPVHGIPHPDLLSKGVGIFEIPKKLKRAWQGALLISDNPSFDAAWISQVYTEKNIKSPWTIIEFDVLFSALYQFTGINSQTVYEIVAIADKIPRPHRAGPDALRLNQIARMVVDPVWREELLLKYC